MWAARVWWVLQSWGFDNVSILNGWFHSSWAAAGLPVTIGQESYAPQVFDHSSLIDRKELVVREQLERQQGNSGRERRGGIKEKAGSKEAKERGRGRISKIDTNIS